MGAQLPRFSRVSILIAAFNEEATLRPCVERVLAAPLPEGIEREVVLVDDGSRDATWRVALELARGRPNLRIFQQSKNQGKGAALRRAIAEMTGEIAIFQDADLEYDPADYSRLLKPILNGRADVVYGSRFIGEERKVLYFWHTIGNRLLTLLANMFNNLNLTDMETGYKVFVAKHLKNIPLKSNRFGIEPEITAKIALNRLRVYEVPISYDGRTYEQGKKIGWRDGLAALGCIVKYRFNSHYADSGKVALDALEQAPQFNAWLYDSVKPYLGERIAELGAGRGNLSQWLRKDRRLLATDFRQEYLNELRTRWGHHDGFQVAPLDLCEPGHYEMLRAYAPDTVVCLNVLEHILEDRAVLARLFRVLPLQARLVFLVPYNPRLTSEFDRQIGHFRRYRRGELEQKMEEAGFCVERQFFFNKIGVLAWWLGNTLLGQRSITPRQLRIYNALTPLIRRLDRLLPTSGLSTIVIARKVREEQLRIAA